MNKKGQGVTESLIILAVVVVCFLILMIFGVKFPGINSNFSSESVFLKDAKEAGFSPTCLEYEEVFVTKDVYDERSCVKLISYFNNQSPSVHEFLSESSETRNSTDMEGRKVTCDWSPRFNDWFCEINGTDFQCLSYIKKVCKSGREVIAR